MREASSGYRCYHCGSTNATKHGFYKERQRLYCHDCGRRFFERLVDPARMGKATVNSGFRCYHCGSMETAKAGFSRFGGRKKQRFFCRGCRRYFRKEPERFERTTALPSGWLPARLPPAGHLILELRALAQHVLKRTPTVMDLAELSKQNRTYSPKIYQAVFGNFRVGLRRARLTPDYPRKIDEAKLLEELRALRKKLGRPVVKRDVEAAYKKGRCSSLYFFRRAFGSFQKAVETAGVGPKRYSRVEMIYSLRRLYVELDRPINNTDVAANSRAGRGPFTRAIVKEFGGFAEACRIARVKTTYGNREIWRYRDRKKPPRKYTDEVLIAQLRELRETLGRKPTSRDINRACKERRCATSNVFANAFGSLLEAYRRAGFEGVSPRRRS